MTRLFYEASNETRHYRDGHCYKHYDSGNGQASFWKDDEEITEAEFNRVVHAPEISNERWN